MKSILRITNKIVFILSIIIVIIVGLFAMAARFNIPGGFRIYSVLTGSMEPKVPTGSLLLSKIPKSSTDISQGNVITFIEPGYQNKFVTHRVYKIIQQGKVTLFQTKGDANKSQDPWRIAYGSIKGVYILGIPYLGYVLNFIRTPKGLVIFVYIPIVIISIFEIRNIFEILFQMKLQKEKSSHEDVKTKNHQTLVVFLVLGLTILLLGSSKTYALFQSNKATILNSKISTAEVFGTPTPTVSPTPTPTATTTPTMTPPTPTSSGCGGNVTISNNGNGSKNTVDNNCDNTTSINQSNNSNVNIDVKSSSSSNN